MTYRSVGSIPCLLPTSRRVRRRWADALSAFAHGNARVADRLLAQSTGPAIPELARRRIGRLRSALADHAHRVGELFSAVGIEPTTHADPDRERSGHRPAGAGLPGDAHIESYVHQLHRDWGWDEHGTSENREALRCVAAALDPASVPRDILVLGAGGCRLSIDLHRVVDARLTVALDINPLPFLVVARLAAGDAVPMYEFPLSPRTSETAVVDRSLHSDAPIPDGFVPIFGDGLQPPVVPGAFDTLFTPWFIDQVPTDLRQVIDVATRVLPIGGVWINHGPLVYRPEHTMFAHQYREDEVLALLEASGFAVEYASWERLLYMQSPAGSQGRTEGVLTFRARRHAEVRRAGHDRAEPAWLTDPDVAVPTLAGLASYSPPHPMFGAVVALVDGRRTARDIARVLVDKHGLPPDAAVGGVMACLREIVSAVGREGIPLKRLRRSRVR